MKKKIIYGGEEYVKASEFLNCANPNEYLALELLLEGASRNDLYCISILYNDFFHLDDAMLYEIMDMELYLEMGRKNKFWLSFYQSFDFIQKLQESNFKGKTFIEMEDPIELLKLANKYFRALPSEITDVSDADIGKTLMLSLLKRPLN